MPKMLRQKTIVLLLIEIIAIIVIATTAYSSEQSIQKFIASSFTTSPSKNTLWLNKDIKQQLEQATGTAVNKLKFVYRHNASKSKTAWLIKQLGKEHLITFGFIIQNNAIEKMKVLHFTESRGFAIKLPFFTQQFINLHLTKKQQLSISIDNITGATYSVRAAKKAARLALLLHKIVVSTAP